MTVTLGIKEGRRPFAPHPSPRFRQRREVLLGQAALDTHCVLVEGPQYSLTDRAVGVETCPHLHLCSGMVQALTPLGLHNAKAGPAFLPLVPAQTTP